MSRPLRLLVYGDCPELDGCPLHVETIRLEATGPRGSLQQEIGRADLAVLEVRGDDESPLSVLRYLRAVSPQCGTVMIVEPQALSLVQEAISEGLDEVLIRSGSVDELKPILTHQLQRLMQGAYLKRRLHESERRFWSFFEHSPMGLVIAGAAGGIEHANPAFQEFLGYSLEELRTERLGGVLGESGRAIWEPLAADFAEGTRQFLRVSQEFVHRSGARREGHCAFLASLDEEENLSYLLGMVTDATEERRIQDNLMHADKMYAMGQVAGGVAHDFNNLLTIVNSHCYLMGDGLDDPERLQWSLDRIDLAIKRGSQLTRQLLTLGRRSTGEDETLQPNELLEELRIVLESLFGKKVRVDFALAEDLRSVPMERAHFEQLIMNLAINARDALPRGGRFTVRTYNLDYRAPRSDAPPQLPYGEYTVLEISDNGLGMATDVQARIFEPFFTTKPVGAGTGLGLATVRTVLENYAGEITVNSEEGRGTEFCIYLPSAEQRTDTPPKLRRARKGTPQRGAETILLVEDELELRAPIRRLLEDRGYTVIEASSAEEALFASREYGGPIHLLLSDVIMPGDDGALLAEKVRSERPETAVVLMSGYTAEVLSLEEELPYRLLQKPFGMDLLSRVIRQTLNQG